MITIFSQNGIKTIAVIFILLTLLIGCTTNNQTINSQKDILPNKFAVYLVDSQQIFFSEEDISSYDPSTQTFIFTSEGAKKVDPFQSTVQINSGLYQKLFVVKLGDEEIYRGKFWSPVSSLSEPGIVMYASAIGQEDNTLTVSSGYASSELLSDKRRINDPRIIEHFKKINKIK